MPPQEVAIQPVQPKEERQEPPRRSPARGRAPRGESLAAAGGVTERDRRAELQSAEPGIGRYVHDTV